MAEPHGEWSQHVESRHKEAIAYYWKASQTNKQTYKTTRVLTVVLGALVTLIASLSSSEFITHDSLWNPVFAFGTPILAAMLTITAGFSQSFQWGSAWQNMVLTAQRIEKERDRFLVTDLSKRDHHQEMELLNEFIISESKNFFDRMLGGSISSKESKKPSS